MSKTDYDGRNRYGKARQKSQVTACSLHCGDDCFAHVSWDGFFFLNRVESVDFSVRTTV